MKTVVKVGGAQLETPERVRQIVAHVRQLVEKGREVVLVHGGGGEIGALHERLDVPWRTHHGLRVTHDESMDIVAMVLCGLVNKRLVARLVAAGVPALGLCGADLGLMRTSLLNADRLGRVGGPPSVDHERLGDLLDRGHMLVLSPVCLGPDGDLVNVNADTVAQTVAVALDADCLEFVTDVDGVRTSTGNAGRLSTKEAQRLIRESVIKAGMIPKVQAAVAALDGGVVSVRVGTPQSLAQGTATEVHA
jgi:acetylglutamate kinase